MIPEKLTQWRALAEQYAALNKIDIDSQPLAANEILAIIWNESSGDPSATNPHDPSWGLMGVTFPIGKAFAGVETPTALLDPETNIRAGSGFLAHLKRRFAAEFPDTWSDAYNEGETHLSHGVVLTPDYSAAFRAHLVELAAAT